MNERKRGFWFYYDNIATFRFDPEDWGFCFYIGLSRLTIQIGCFSFGVTWWIYD